VVDRQRAPLEGVPTGPLRRGVLSRHRAIKAERPAAKVLTAGFVHGDINYMRAALAGIESRGVCPTASPAHHTDSQGWNEASFRDYQLKIALRLDAGAAPLHHGGGNGRPRNPATNTGLIDAMFRHVHEWNAAGDQQVRAICFYRWAAGTDKWAIESNAGMRADFVAALSKDYRWSP
jgi:hypothetical protein